MEWVSEATVSQIDAHAHKRFSSFDTLTAGVDVALTLGIAEGDTVYFSGGHSSAPVGEGSLQSPQMETFLSQIVIERMPSTCEQEQEPPLTT